MRAFDVSAILIIRLDRRVTGNRGGTAHDQLDQLFPVSRHPHGLTHANIGEGGNVRAEHKTTPVAGWHFHHLELVAAGEHRLLLIGDGVFEINLATQQGLHAGLAITDPDDFHLGHTGRTLPVIHVGFELGHASRIIGNQLERAGTNAAGGDAVPRIFRNDPEPVIHQLKRHISKRGRQREFHGHVIRCFHFFDHLDR